LRAYVLATALLLLCSFYVPAADPPLARPVAAVLEERMRPQPYGVDHRFEQIVDYYCDDTGVPKWLACRLIGQESVGNPMAGWWDENAVSYMGAVGLTQQMPDHVSDPYFIALNDGEPIDLRNPLHSIRVRPEVPPRPPRRDGELVDSTPRVQRWNRPLAPPVEVGTVEGRERRVRARDHRQRSGPVKYESHGLPHLIPKGTKARACKECKAKVFDVTTTRSGVVIFNADGFPHTCDLGKSKPGELF
jgi:hypothetical protein